jgi:hypothetical protein
LAAAGTLATAVVVVSSFALPFGAVTQPVENKALPSLSSTRARALAAVETYAAIAQRPLFTPARRPASVPPPKEVAPAPPPSPPPPPELPKVLLLAVAISPDRREALLRLPTGPSSTLAEGDALEGWILDKVLPDRVVFRFGDMEKELAFPAPQASRPRGPRPQAPPPRR